MRIPISIATLLFSAYFLNAQPNCEAYKFSGDTLKYRACKHAEGAFKFGQFTSEFQEILDEAINIDSTYAYAYREKSVAYLKSGDFIKWKQLMDKAVKFDPKQNLDYRGWCRYQFFRDYKGAIEDFKMLQKIAKHNLHFSANGDYHINIAKALCYKALGNKGEAIDIILKQLQEKDHTAGMYDYLHLGVLYLETGATDKAITAFETQTRENDIAENHYYWGLALISNSENEKGLEHLEQAKSFYLKGKKMFDPYTHPMDKIFLKDIEEQIFLLAAKN